MQQQFVGSGLAGVLSRVMETINHQFGTYRGLIRLTLAQINWRFGRYSAYQAIDYDRMRRLVFVCQGNICRSPFAHLVADGLLDDVPVASIGLATTSGTPADPLAMKTAAAFSVDLSLHQATDVTDFDIQDGDVFAVMEDRHIDALRPHIRGKHVQMIMLGLWCQPRFALLYDPHRLSPGYFYACFDRIKRAVDGLVASVPERNASASPG